VGFLLVATAATALAIESTPDVTAIRIEAGRPVIQFKPIPAAIEYTVYGGPDFTQPLSLLPGTHRDFLWTGSTPTQGGSGFLRVRL
jgi:hypothetical protein